MSESPSFRAGALLLALLLSAPCGAAAGEIALWWAPSLGLKSLDLLEERLARPFSEGLSPEALDDPWFDGAYFLFGAELTRSGREERAENCLELLEAVARPVWQLDVGRSVLNPKTAPDFYARCQALGRLREARPAAGSFLPELRPEPEVLGLLPHILSGYVNGRELRSVLASEAAGLSWAGELATLTFERDPEFSFETAGEDSSSVRFAPFVIRAAYWAGEGVPPLTNDVFLSPLASGDFDGDGLEDLLLHSRWGYGGGTYSGSRLFLLTRWSGEGPLRLLERESLEAEARRAGGG